ncbi:hypothetical protein UFOVP84_140 [uncultured Caudovirales phage]|uniref:Uncharacterized protein n=1 Tax=uncultured Caudovirales phage TaxID=2100421 RepID=A0A6J5KY01_9CAUD|nr:hypothetical protein UFOVP84_140 [uncultured Caudovirales phage]
MKTYKEFKKEFQLDELSTELLTNYKKKAGESASAADKAGNFKKGNKRFAGIIKATNKQFKNDVKEEVELDEAFKLGYTPRIGKSSHYHPTEIIKAKPKMKPEVAPNKPKKSIQPEKGSHEYWISSQGGGEHKVGDNNGIIARAQSHDHAMEIMHAHAKRNKFKDYHIAGPSKHYNSLYTAKDYKHIKEELELDEVLDTHKGIQSYIKKSAEKRADLVKNDSITKPDHAEIRRKLEKSNKGFDKAIDKQYKLNKK